MNINTIGIMEVFYLPNYRRDRKDKYCLVTPINEMCDLE